MYAIYESYVQLKEAWNDTDSMTRSGLAGGVGLAPDINDNTSKNMLSSGVRSTTDQGSTSGDLGLGQDNEEIKAPKEILKLINSLTRCAHKGDYAGIVVDCMRLSKIASAHVKK